MAPPPSPAAAPRIPVLGRAQARTVWRAVAAGLVVAVLAAVSAARLLPAAPVGVLRELFPVVASVVVVVDLALGVVVAARVRRSAPPAAPPDAVAAAQVIVGSVTSLSAAFLCAVFFAVTHQGLLLLLVVPCALALLRWFPSEARWAALRPSGQPVEPRRTLTRE